MEGTVTISLKEYEELQNFKNAVKSRKTLLEVSSSGVYAVSLSNYYTVEKCELVTALFSELDKKATEISDLNTRLSQKKKGWFR